MRKRKYDLPAHVCWDVTSNNYHISITVDGKRYSSKRNTIREAMDQVVEVLYYKTKKWSAAEAENYLHEYSKYKHLDNTNDTKDILLSKEDDHKILIDILNMINNKSKDFSFTFKVVEYNYDAERQAFYITISDGDNAIAGWIKNGSIDVGLYEKTTKKDGEDQFIRTNCLNLNKDDFCQLIQKIEPEKLCEVKDIDMLIYPDKYQTKIVKPKSLVKSTNGKYMGHITHKYDTIRPKDKYYFDGKWHLLLTNLLHKAQYVLREDGEVFSYNPETGEMKKKVQYFSESGGVKNRARREAGKGGGSVYKTVGLWNSQFLTHKLLSKYFTQDDEIVHYNSTGGKDQVVLKKKKVSENFYKGQMPVGFNKRCYKA